MGSGNKSKIAFPLFKRKWGATDLLKRHPFEGYSRSQILHKALEPTGFGQMCSDKTCEQGLETKCYRRPAPGLGL